MFVVGQCVRMSLESCVWRGGGQCSRRAVVCRCVCAGTRHTREFDVEIYYKLKYKNDPEPDFYESSALVTLRPLYFCTSRYLVRRWPLASALVPGDAYLTKLTWRTGSKASRVTLRECS